MAKMKVHSTLRHALQEGLTRFHSLGALGLGKRTYPRQRQSIMRDVI
jgi:hypothetical protein